MKMVPIEIASKSKWISVVLFLWIQNKKPVITNFSYSYKYKRMCVRASQILISPQHEINSKM